MSQGLPMSASKADVMKRLGLSGRDGEAVYKMMLEEAAQGRDRVSNNFSNLALHLQQANPRVQAPYKWDELQETARHREILTIVQYAGRYTAAYFQMGGYTTNAAVENWVAQWFMWHAFRYRDNRPKPVAPIGGHQYNQSGNPNHPGPYWTTVLRHQ